MSAMGDGIVEYTMRATEVPAFVLAHQIVRVTQQRDQPYYATMHLSDGAAIETRQTRLELMARIHRAFATEPDASILIGSLQAIYANALGFASAIGADQRARCQYCLIAQSALLALQQYAETVAPRPFQFEETCRDCLEDST